MLHRLANDTTIDAQRLAFSPDGEFLVCQNGDSGLKLWHLPSQVLKWSVSLTNTLARSK